MPTGDLVDSEIKENNQAEDALLRIALEGPRRTWKKAELLCGVVFLAAMLIYCGTETLREIIHEGDNGRVDTLILEQPRVFLLAVGILATGFCLYAMYALMHFDTYFTVTDIPPTNP